MVNYEKMKFYTTKHFHGNAVTFQIYLGSGIGKNVTLDEETVVGRTGNTNRKKTVLSGI